ncbi:MAG: anti-sigma factor antagonist [Gaiellales bacterium]|jgi:anti-anti-sigma factor|nr:anti-sigma factor antagonist [Gaiellales bacterium]
MVDRDMGTAEAEQLGESLWLLRLVGENDLSTASSLNQALHRIEQTGTTVVVDFCDAVFVDSSVIGALIKQQQRGETLLLVAPQRCRVRRSLDLMGLTQKMPTFESREEALREASSQPSTSSP